MRRTAILAIVFAATIAVPGCASQNYGGIKSKTSSPPPAASSGAACRDCGCKGFQGQGSYCSTCGHPSSSHGGGGAAPSTTHGIGSGEGY